MYQTGKFVTHPSNTFLYAQVNFDDPSRFKVEIAFSPGTAFDPSDDAVRDRFDLGSTHTMTEQPRVMLHPGDGVTIQQLEDGLYQCYQVYERQSKGKVRLQPAFTPEQPPAVAVPGLAPNVGLGGAE